MENRPKYLYVAVLIGLITVVLQGCQQVTEEDIAPCVEAAKQAQFEAKQAYDSCFLAASDRMIEIMDNCDQIAPEGSREHSQCLREAIAQFRTDVGICVDAHNASIKQAIDNMRDCIREVVNPGGN